MYCNKCGAEIPEGTKICAECGAPQEETKFCQHCGAMIDKDCIICPKCGKQVGQIKQEQPQVIINNSNMNSNVNRNANVGGKSPNAKNKWVAFFLCLFLGGFGAHKFYEGKILLGIVYLFTAGLFFTPNLLLCSWNLAGAMSSSPVPRKIRCFPRRGDEDIAPTEGLGTHG